MPLGTPSYLQARRSPSRHPGPRAASSQREAEGSASSFSDSLNFKLSTRSTRLLPFSDAVELSTLCA